MSAWKFSLSVRWNAPISRFSVTDMRGNRRRPSGLCAMPPATIVCGDAEVMSRPSNRIVPWRGRLSPLIARSVVDLPAPFAPISVTISPAPTRREMPLSAWMAP